jgi:hypothetical protein
LRTDATFLDACDFSTWGFLTIIRLDDDFAGAAWAVGATRANDKAKNPTIFSARLKSCFDMMDIACLDCDKGRG